MISKDCYRGWKYTENITFKYVMLRSALEFLCETKVKMMSCLQNDSFGKLVSIFS